VRKFNFRDNQSLILVLESIDFPNESMPWKLVAQLLDNSTLSQAEQDDAIRERDGIFKLEAANLGDRGFEGKRCPGSIDDADAKRDGAIARQIALADKLAPSCSDTPTLIPDQEPPFRFRKALPRRYSNDSPPPSREVAGESSSMNETSCNVV
jgi:hypothetical protein